MAKNRQSAQPRGSSMAESVRAVSLTPSIEDATLHALALVFSTLTELAVPIWSRHRRVAKDVNQKMSVCMVESVRWAISLTPPTEEAQH